MVREHIHTLSSILFIHVYAFTHVTHVGHVKDIQQNKLETTRVKTEPMLPMLQELKPICGVPESPSDNAYPRNAQSIKKTMIHYRMPGVILQIRTVPPWQHGLTPPSHNPRPGPVLMFGGWVISRGGVILSGGP